MNFNRYRGDLTVFITRLKTADLSLAMLSIACLILSIKILFTHERIVLTPMSLDERMAVSWNSADTKFYEKSALFASVLMGNINPDNVTFVREQIRNMATGSLYGQLDKRLEEDAQSIKLKGQSVSFVAENVFYDDKLNRCFVTGMQKIESKTGATANEKITYEFEIGITKGLPELRWYDLYSGDAHDSVWLFGKQRNKSAGGPNNGEPVPAG